MKYKEYGYSDKGSSCAHSYLLEDLLCLLDRNKNKIILDIGCGNGYLAKELLKKGFNVYGIDASQQGIEFAKKDYPDRFFVQDINDKKLPQEIQHLKFDTVISTEVIEHLYFPREFVSFCKRIIERQQDGELILSTPYHGYLKNLFLAILNKYDHHYTALWDGGHIKFWSKKTLTKLLEEQGFVVTIFKGSGRFPYLWKSMFIKAKLV
jgi:2-polyprenyl-3-methyl-5-hydroxy-6-metoxy-1,4-benzoquinol methylase